MEDLMTAEPVAEPAQDNSEAIAAEVPPPTPKLNLDQARKLTLSFAGLAYSWIFRRVTAEDWLRFFSSMATEATYIGGDAVETFEVDTAFVELAMAAVTEVYGYRAALSTADKSWRSRLPVSHLRAFGFALRDARPGAAPDNLPVDLSELQTVYVDCTWSDAPEGGTLRFSGLEHRFTPPTIAQLRTYNRRVNTTRVKGNGRAGTTIYAIRQTAMIALYDEIIADVDEAYCSHGATLKGARQDVIAFEMDGCHKVAAIQALLNGSGPDAPLQ